MKTGSHWYDELNRRSREVDGAHVLSAELQCILDIQTDARAEALKMLRFIRTGYRTAGGPCRFCQGSGHPERHVSGCIVLRIDALLAEAPEPERAELTPEIVRNALLLVERVVPLGVVEFWTTEQQRQAGEWAAALHTQASDNDDVVVPPEPEWTKPYEVNFKGRYVRDVDAGAPARPAPAADTMHLGSHDYRAARARSFASLKADERVGGAEWVFCLGHDEGFELGLSVASVNKLVAAHEPHLEALRDATAAVRDRSSEPTAEQVAEAVRERCATRFVQSRHTAEYGISGSVVRSIYEFILATPLAPILEKLGAEPSAAGGSTGD